MMLTFGPKMRAALAVATTTNRRLAQSNNNQLTAASAAINCCWATIRAEEADGTEARAAAAATHRGGASLLQHCTISLGGWSSAAVPSRQFSSLSSVRSTNAAVNACGMSSTNSIAMQKPPRRTLTSQEITANLHLISAQPRNVKRDPKTLRLLHPIDRPLVIMPAWLLAKRKPLHKYAEIYVKLGFDVLTIQISPWQLFWPAKGSQLVGQDVVNFLHHNTACSPLFMHGFSVGAYVWGECMVHISRDLPRYEHILQRIVGQVWDSAADITEIPVGVPKAVFPNNPRLYRALSNYMQYHLRTFHDIATQHYLLSSHMFHQNLVRAPALMFVSEDDPVGSVSSNQLVRQDWLRLGIECEWKCWQRSEHVSHFMRHRDEYLEVLQAHLERVQLVQAPEAADVEATAKLRAKL